jgi:molecular chaperone DnaJ
MVQAALGTKLQIPTLGGGNHLDVNVDGGAQHADRITVAGEGIPRLKGVGRGDLIVELELQVPTKLSKEQREILLKFAEISGEKVEAGHGNFFSKLFGE